MPSSNGGSRAPHDLVRTLTAWFLTLTAVCAVSPRTTGAQEQEVPEGVHQSARHDFRVDTVAAGFDHPWSMAWLPSGELLVTERTGRLRIVRDGKLEPEPVAGLPEVYRDEGQGGVMDVLPHPDFMSNKLLYLSYGKAKTDSLGATAVVRGRLENDRLVDLEELFVAEAWTTRNNHFAGRMAFDHDGYLFLTVGDRLYPPELLAEHPAQDPSTDFGTIVRLHDDGRIPEDNPFVDLPGHRPEIWSYGHRNQQGLAVHPVTGQVWSNEHGPRGGDELNLVLPGRNYGWPVVTYGINYDGTPITPDAKRRDTEAPRWVWVPSIATSGLVFYDGDRFPWWKGDAFVGGLVGEQLSRVTLDGDRPVGVEALLVGVLGRIRDVRQGPDGLIYLAVEDRNSEHLTEIVRLVPVQGEVLPPG